MAKLEIIVKKYKNEKEYQNDAKKMITRGYEVQSVTSEQPRSGCGRILLIGIFAAIFKPKPVLVVTYRLIRKEFSAYRGDIPSVRLEITEKQDISKNDQISKW